MKTIQIIDDSPSLRQLLTDYFAMKGFRTIESEDGREALKMLNQEDPDLIIVDILMPHINGYQVIEEIKLAKSTPIIVMTSQANIDYRMKSKKMGVDGFIVKPFKMADLYNTVQSVLSAG